MCRRAIQEGQTTALLGCPMKHSLFYRMFIMRYNRQKEQTESVELPLIRRHALAKNTNSFTREMKIDLMFSGAKTPIKFNAVYVKLFGENRSG